MKLDSVQDVFADQIGDLRSAETQLLDALPKMAEAATDAELKEAFRVHLEQTRVHARRLDDIIHSISISVPDEQCEAMRGLIAEGDEIVDADARGSVKDVALIAAAQRVEHYEIAAYGTARALAKELDLPEAASLLHDTLDEESAADRLLTKIATGGLMTSGLNEAANR